MSSEKIKGLVGTWYDQQEILSSVEYTVTATENGYAVTAIDTYDSESGEVSEVVWEQEVGTLKFSCYWPSSGSYSKCKFHQFTENKVEFTYTYTDHEILVRKDA